MLTLAIQESSSLPLLLTKMSNIHSHLLLLVQLPSLTSWHSSFEPVSKMLSLFPLNFPLFVCLTHWSSLPQLIPGSVSQNSQDPSQSRDFHLVDKDIDTQRGDLPKSAKVIRAGGEE